MATEFGGKQRGGPATGVPESRPERLHHVVARDGDEGLEILRTPLEGKGRVLPVFSAGWAARGYLFAEVPGGGWHVKACAPDELISLLAGPCAAGAEWVALDPRPGRHGGVEAPSAMPRENFVDYLLGSRVPVSLGRGEFGIVGDAPHGRGNDR